MERIPGARDYRNPAIPRCRDANHAVVTQVDDMTPVVLDALVWMHEDQERETRIRSTRTGPDQDTLKALLSRQGFRFEPWQDVAVMARSPGAVPSVPALSPGVEIRRFRPGEAVPATFWPDAPWVTDRLGQARDSGSCEPWGLWQDGVPVSTATLFPSGPGTCLDLVATLPDRRGQGFCKALLSALLGADASGKTLFWLECRAGGPRELYAALGFGVLPGVTDDWEAWLPGNGSGPGKGRSTEDRQDRGRDSSPRGAGSRGSPKDASRNKGRRR